MKTKRILALVLAALMIVASFASCRTKDENAFTFTRGDKTVNIRTALYMCFLIDADISFQNEATAIADEKEAKYEDYKDLKLDDKDYITWTKDEAKTSAERYAYAELEFDRLGLEITAEDQEYIDYYAESQWNGDSQNAGISEVYEANGISFDTYKSYFANSYFKQEMVYNFYVEEKENEEDHDHEDGSTHATTKPLSPELEKIHGSLRPDNKEIDSALNKNFVVINHIQVSFYDDEGKEKDESTKKTQLALLKDFVKLIDEGQDFASVYSKYKVAFGLSTESTKADPSEYEQIVLSAKANEVINDNNTADDLYTDAAKLENGKATVVETDSSYSLIMRRNIMTEKDADGNAFKDSYYNYAIRLLVNDEYEENFVLKTIKELDCKTNDSAIKFYSADKIDYLNEETEAAQVATELAQ